MSVEQKMLDVSKDIIPAFEKVILSRKRYLYLFGGAGSGKSFSAAQKVIFRSLGRKKRGLVVRKIARTLKQSVFQRIRDQIHAWDLSFFCKINKSDMHIEFANGSELLFTGMDNPEKIKSIDRIDHMWLEEATEFTEKDVDMLDLRMRGDTASYFQMMFSFNPVSIHHFLKKRVDAHDSESFIHHSTYKDNPFVGKTYERTLTKLNERNPNLGNVYMFGKWGVFEGLIFKMMDYSPWPSPLHEDSLIYMMDFGFTNPTTLLEVKTIDDYDVFVRELIYKTELTNEDRIAEMDRLEVNKTAPIYGDPADPTAITSIYKAGYNIYPADKGSDSVMAGIELMQGLRIHTLPSNENFNFEMENYQWLKDKEGNKVDAPVKKFDHCVDALRMGIYTHMGPRMEEKRLEVDDLEDEFGYVIPNMGEEMHA